MWKLERDEEKASSGDFAESVYKMQHIRGIEIPWGELWLEELQLGENNSQAV